MRITEVRVTLAGATNDRLRAFCSITLDDEFVVRDLRVIETGDSYFVAMPNRKVTDRCSQCKSANHLRAKYCNHCGHRLPPGRDLDDATSKDRLHIDIAHPINADTRSQIQDEVLKAFLDELEKDGGVPRNGAPNGHNALPDAACE